MTTTKECGMEFLLDGVRFLISAFLILCGISLVGAGLAWIFSKFE